MRLRTLAVAAGLAASMVAAHAEDKHTHWDYKGKAGAEHWGDLAQEFSTCKLGKEQSPIDIQTKDAKPAKLSPIEFHYTAGPAEVINNGHTIQVNLASGGTIKLADGEYKLLQFHFHAPSEEKIDGKNFPLVAHLVHKNDAGKLAVVAVLFNKGKENAALKPVFAHLPAKAGAKQALDGEFNAQGILPEQQAYYAFKGSLTTPPCSEDVRWQVLKTPSAISAKQLSSFTKLYPMNARPVQPLNGRTVEVSE